MLCSLVDGVQLLVVFALFHIHVALGCYIAVGDDVIDQFAIVVNHGMNAELYVFV